MYDEATANNTAVQPDALLQRAQDAYQPGISYRELAATLGISKDKARDLVRRLREKGIIDT